MTRVRPLKSLALCGAVLLAGCAQPLTVLPGPNKDYAAFQRDDTACRPAGVTPEAVNETGSPTRTAYLQCMAAHGDSVVRVSTVYPYGYPYPYGVYAAGYPVGAYAYPYGYPFYDPLFFGPTFGFGVGFYGGRYYGRDFHRGDYRGFGGERGFAGGRGGFAHGEGGGRR